MVTNTTTTKTLTEANEQLALAQTQIVALQTSGREGCGGRRGRGYRGGCGGRGARGHIRTVHLYNNRNYCHTHGYGIHDNHTGATCNSKAE